MNSKTNIVFENPTHTFLVSHCLIENVTKYSWEFPQKVKFNEMLCIVTMILVVLSASKQMGGLDTESGIDLFHISHPIPVCQTLYFRWIEQCTCPRLFVFLLPPLAPLSRIWQSLLLWTLEVDHMVKWAMTNFILKMGSISRVTHVDFLDI